MTDQANDTIFYNGSTYPLLNYPLSGYLEKFGGPHFEFYSTANWRGYQGTWELKDKKLFLTAIDSAKHTIEDLFPSEAPIFARWFSGTLLIGVGARRYTTFSSYHDHYLAYNVEEGICTDSFWTQLEKDEIVLDFGKHQGRLPSEIICGDLKNREFNQILQQYLKDIIVYLCKDRSKPIMLPDIEPLLERFPRLSTKKLNNYDIPALIGRNYIALDDSSALKEHSAGVVREFSALLEELLKLPFNQMLKFSHPGPQDEETFESSYRIKPSRDYIIWAINNVDSFYVVPSVLNRTFECYYLETFKCKRLHPLIFSYEPRIKVRKEKIPQAVLDLNLNKFERFTGTKYDAGSAWYIMSKSDSSRLDELYFSNSMSLHSEESSGEEEDWSDEEVENGDWDYNPHNPSHDPSENPWIDVFGPGEEAEDAFWNTD